MFPDRPYILATTLKFKKGILGRQGESLLFFLVLCSTYLIFIW